MGYIFFILCFYKVSISHPINIRTKFVLIIIPYKIFGLKLFSFFWYRSRNKVFPISSNGSPHMTSLSKPELNEVFIRGREKTAVNMATDSNGDLLRYFLIPM